MPLTQTYLTERINQHITDVISKSSELHYISELDLYATINLADGRYSIFYDKEGNVKITNITAKNFKLALLRMICARHGENPENFS